MSRFFAVAFLVLVCFAWAKANDNFTALADSLCDGDSIVSLDYKKERKAVTLKDVAGVLKRINIILPLRLKLIGDTN